MRLRLLPLILLAGLAGCASMQRQLPWYAPDEPPRPVRELRVEVPADGQVPIVLQFRERNTLVVDLTGVAARGSVELRPGASGQWPARMALRFQPGRFEAIEVRGAQRTVFPVTADRAGAATVALPPATHPAGTSTLRVTWGSQSDF